MRKVLFMVLMVLVLVPAAAAKNPHDQTEPSPSIPVIVGGPTKLAPGAVTGQVTSVAPAGGVASASADCGACIVQCWGATARSGPGDWSGHVYIYQHVSWCGNGAQITSAGASQNYEQAGWYQLQAGYGPWFSGGCVGCSSIAVSGYILWNWTAQLIGVSHSGTSNLTTTMYAYGGAGAS